ncbi:hypothetical protein AXF42_Ash016677 [Apostasia shenzhenica]|uniref:Uncharacterized protein n=1 Tax=Apostasia shenzhenica TaxID=1088818 RepID=A0A2I0APZ7_9ASPA|nr:hypothetical protein AXF42_Ash016677 [Apostasia shenzhenica]
MRALHKVLVSFIVFLIGSHPCSGRPAAPGLLRQPEADISLTHAREIRVEARSPVRTPEMAAKYGPLLLNLLPRGKFPPSSPSKGTDSGEN